MNYITMVDRTDESHRSNIIIHIGILDYFKEFYDKKELDEFARQLGFTYELEEEKRNTRNGIMKIYRMSHTIIDDYSGGFWSLGDEPLARANLLGILKPIRLMTWGSVVTCYFINDGTTIRIFRPNVNAKEVYK